MTDALTATDAHLFDIRPATRWMNDIQKASGLGANKHFRGQNPQGGTAISYYLKSAPSGDAKITIANLRGDVIREVDQKPVKTAADFASSLRGAGRDESVLLLVERGDQHVFIAVKTDEKSRG